ncbi:MAG: NAD(P)H-binding protein, partial [Bryobacteraceae bacterium]
QLIPELLAREHSLRLLVRDGSVRKLPPGCEQRCEIVPGNALDLASYETKVRPADTFIHLVGVAHPNASKGQLFRDVDLVSIRAGVKAAKSAAIRHFIYVSVAHPSPIMEDYIDVRREGESLIRDAGLNATILRPWYVLGPGHRWPAMLKPLYWLMEQIPSTERRAKRLGLVTLDQMIRTLVRAVETPVSGVKVVKVPEIRQE